MDGQYLPDDAIDIDSLALSEPPEYLIQGFARGGEASLDSSTESMNKYLLAEEEASPTAYATMPSAPTEPQAPEMSTAKSMLKRLATKGERGGKSSRPKGMGMELGDLTPAIPEIGAPLTEQEKLVKIATARSQFDALERAYKLKAAAAAKSGKGLARPTFNAVNLGQPTLEKPGPLMARTFQFGGLVKGMKAMGKKGTPDPAQLMPSSAARGAQEGAVASPSIIKDEGGNWMGGYKSPEDFVKPLYKAENLDNPNKAKALNQWIDKKMTPYIKNKMATPSDPLRKLAEEEGILPFPDTMVNAEVTANISRIAAGLPVEQQGPMATTTRGQAWENRADAAINVGPYNEMIPFGYSNDQNEVLRQFGGEFAVQNPTAKVSGMNVGRPPSDLGFDHVIDVLQENMTTGRLSADSLRGLSMEDAVRLTYQYDQDMAKKMAEASIQALKGVPVYKAYPEQGFRWMQLDKPGYFAAESDAMGHSVRGYEPPKGHPDWTPQSGNSGSLGYGYGGWEAIKSGDVKVYSLADDLGKRYTTVEAVKGKHPLDYTTYSLGARVSPNGFPEELLQDGSIPKEKLQEIYALGKKMYFENPNAYAENRLLTGAPTPSAMDSFQKAADQIIGELPFAISQIKGPSNSSVKGEVQPFVQDFLNSGNWATVNDLSLTGLRDVKRNPELENYIKSNQLDDRRFLTKAEYNKYKNDFLRNELKGQLGGFDPMAPSPVQPEGMAEGGEAKKDEDLPGILGVSSYARGRAAGMFPEESSQWTSQDTARHMLASGTLARKYGPRIAELAGYAHEIKEQPIKFIGAKLGMTKESPDYTQDIHNNLLGIELASRSKSQEDLLELVKQMAADARYEQTSGKAWKGKPAGSSPSVGRYGSQGPIKRQEGSPKTGELPNIEDTSSAPFEMIKGAGRINIEDKQIENMMLGLGTNSSMLGLDLSKMKQGEKENLAKNLMAAYRTKIGETDVNVMGMRPMDAPSGTYMGNISAAVPVYGNDRMIVGMRGMQTPYQSGRTGYNLGYSGQVGPGRLDAMMMQPKDSSQGRAYQVQYRMPIGRADGSPATGEGELTQEEIDAASKPAFITPGSGRGRQAGNISKALASGKAYSAAAKGVTELPYDLLGLPMDLTMLARQALTGLEPTGQFGTSDYIKQMAGLGKIRPEPPADPTEKGFYTAGELLSNFTNPAAVTRGGVKVAQKTGQAAGEAAKTLEDLTVGEVQRARVRKAGKKAENIPDTAYDPLRERLEATGNLAYVVRPTGSMMNTMGESNLSKFIKDAQERLGDVLPDNLDKAQRAQRELLIKDFWQTKAKNYFEKQFGTPNDPISDLIKTKRIKGAIVSDRANFPDFLMDQLAAGKTRVREAQRPSPDFTGPMQIDPSQTRFYPKYPPAFEEFAERYDTQTGLTGALVSKEPGLMGPDYTYSNTPLGKQRVDEARQAAIEKLIEQGVDPTLINPKVDLSTRSVKDPQTIVGPLNARALYKQYESSPGFIGKMLGEGPSLPQELLTAIEKKEPIYDIDSFGPALADLFKAKGINKYLASLSERELKNAQFPDIVQAANASREQEQSLSILDQRIRKGKAVPKEVFETGVSAPIGQIKTGPYEGYAWKQLETAASTVPEGAYIGHSVGGYALGGIGYAPEKVEAFNQGRYQIYSLRDNRNRPVTTVEVYMVDENTPVVRQIKGNGRATGNTAPEKYDNLVVDFFQNYLNPRAIEEKDEFLTPVLKKYRDTINSTFSMP